MRVWYVLMATFITLMIASVLLLVSLGDLRENQQVTLSQMDGIYNVQDASFREQSISSYPWQLDFITLGTKSEIALASMPYYLLPCIK
jgi:hypothetical protein